MQRRLAFAVVIGVMGTAILIGLGIWQVNRLAWKEGKLAEIDARIGAAPVAVPEAPDPEADRYLPVVAEGTLGAEALHVLVGAKDRGAGYRVIQPMTLADGRRIMVDRGFIDTDAKDTPRPGGAARVTGNLHWPDEVDRWTPAPDIAGNIWFARDVPQMAATLGTEPVLVVARSVNGGAPVTPLPVDSADIPNDHLQYAVTWFSLAAIWAGMTGYFLWRGRRAAKDGTT